MFDDFDVTEIRNSLHQETGFSNEIADIIACDTASHIRTLNPDFLSAPSIRELVCVALLERNFEKERAKYTRLVYLFMRLID